MSYATEVTTSEMTTMAAPDGVMPKMTIGQPTSFRIARSGARPIKFLGTELAMAMSFTPEIPYWYEINIYRTTNSEFVVAVRMYQQSEELRDTVEAWELGSLDEALEAIRVYDAAADVQVFMPIVGENPCGADIAARALELRARIEGQRQHYRGLVGEIMYELDPI